MLFTAKAEGARASDEELEWEIESNSAENAFHEAKEMFGLGIFRGPIQIYDKSGKLILVENMNGDPERQERLE